MNKAIRLVLKMSSRRDINVKKNYKMVRRIIRFSYFSHGTDRFPVKERRISLKDREIPIRIFGEDGTVKPVLLFFHGGGFTTGTLDSYHHVCKRLSKMSGHLVISVDYRLAPEFPFPAGLEDCYEVTRKMILGSKKYFHINAEQITIMGDSAGGNLAAAVSLMAKEKGEFQVARQVLVYPSVYNDFTEDSPFPSVHENGTDYFMTRKRLQDYIELYQSCPEDKKNPYFSPYRAEDLSGQPKTLVVTAQYDPLRDEGNLYAEKLKSFGNQVELHKLNGLWHGFFTLPLAYEPVKNCYQLICKFLMDK